jgi:hypothetical protein
MAIAMAMTKIPNIILQQPIVVDVDFEFALAVLMCSRYS